MVIYPNPSVMATQDKGSFGNKINCAGEHILNTAVGGLKTAAVLGGGGLLTYGLAKSSIVNRFIEETYSKLKSTKLYDKFLSKGVDFINKGINKFKALPKAGKIIAVAGSALTAMVAQHIINKHTFKAGQIDQKYTDRANMERAIKW